MINRCNNMMKKTALFLSICTAFLFVQCARQHRGIPRGDGYGGVGKVETTIITKNDAVIIRQELSTSNDTTQLETTSATTFTTEETEQVAATKSLQDESGNASKTIAQVVDSTQKEVVVNEEDLVKGRKNIKRASGFLTVGTIGLIALFGGIIGAIISGTLGGIFVGALISFLGSILWIIGLIGAWVVLSKFKKIEFVDEKDFQKHKRQKVLGIILLAPIFIYALFFLIVAFA